MSPQSLYRLSGVALLIGGILFAIGNLLHPTTHSPSAHGAATWQAAHVTFMVGMIGILLGLPGLYGHLAHKLGRLGLAGYVAFFAGMAATLGSSWFEAFGVTSLDEPSIHAVEHGSGVAFNILFGLLFVGGQMVLGFVFYRSRVVARLAALALVGSAIVLLVPVGGAESESAGILTIASTAALGIAFACIGAGVVRQAAVTARGAFTAPAASSSAA
jgi:hypothetical protein